MPPLKMRPRTASMQMKAVLLDQNGTPYTLNHDCQSWRGIKGYGLIDLKKQHSPPTPPWAHFHCERGSVGERACWGAALVHYCPLPFHQVYCRLTAERAAPVVCISEQHQGSVFQAGLGSVVSCSAPRTLKYSMYCFISRSKKHIIRKMKNEVGLLLALDVD